MIRYIAIEGNIGAGKTTLANYLSKLLEAELILENFENNPYLEEFYRSNRGNAFETETFFLKDRIRQLEAIKHDKNYVADFSLLKSSVFAEVNLEKEQLDSFKIEFQKGYDNLIEPDVILFLSNNPEDLKQKIERRGRSFENVIENDYLEIIEKGYLEMFNNIKSIPIIIIESKNILFPFERDQIQQIVNYLLNADHKGVMKLEGL